MKNHALFSSTDKSKNLKCRLLQFLFCALRVNRIRAIYMMQQSSFVLVNVADVSGRYVHEDLNLLCSSIIKSK